MSKETLREQLARTQFTDDEAKVIYQLAKQFAHAESDRRLTEFVKDVQAQQLTNDYNSVPGYSQGWNEANDELNIALEATLQRYIGEFK